MNEQLAKNREDNEYLQTDNNNLRDEIDFIKDNIMINGADKNTSATGGIMWHYLNTNPNMQQFYTSESKKKAKAKCSYNAPQI